MIFAYVEHNEGYYNKLAYETVTYAKFIANQLNKEKVIVLSINPSFNSDELYKFGANYVIELRSQELKIFDAALYAKVLMENFTGNYFIFSHSSESSAIAAQISIKKDILLITNVIGFPFNINPIRVKRRSFSGKGIMEVRSSSNSVLITIFPNSIGIIKNLVKGVLEVKNIDISRSKLVVSSIEKIAKNKISLREAKIIVSAGKGLQGPENWSMIENLAEKLGAAIACSKPVSDLGWRPHSEHVGQTGKTVAPALYFAIGISGAIQHIAGINQSNIIIVINSDPDAPFFKSADYGIIGDAFEIIPKIIKFLNKM